MTVRKQETQDDMTPVWNKKIKATTSVLIDVKVELGEDGGNIPAPVIKTESLLDARHNSSEMVPSTSASASTTPWARATVTSDNVVVIGLDDDDIDVVGHNANPEDVVSQLGDEHLNADELLGDLVAVGGTASVADVIAAAGVCEPMESD